MDSTDEICTFYSTWKMSYFGTIRNRRISKKLENAASMSDLEYKGDHIKCGRCDSYLTCASTWICERYLKCIQHCFASCGKQYSEQFNNERRIKADECDGTLRESEDWTVSIKQRNESVQFLLSMSVRTLEESESSSSIPLDVY